MRSPANGRFLTVFALLTFGGFGCLSLLSYLRARDLMDRQITASTLPLTSDAIVSRLERDLLQPVLASRLMARNTFVEESLSRGETDSKRLFSYLAGFQEKTGAVTTFLVSERSQRYYHPRGVLKIVSRHDPQDAWYFQFRDSGKPLAINVDRDTADLQRTTAFINVRINDAEGRFLGVTGLGLDVRLLQSQLQSYQSRYAARILLLNPEGRIMLASDQSRGLISQLPALRSLSLQELSRADRTQRIADRGRDLYVRSIRIPEIGWNLVLIQQRTDEQKALIDLLAQNLVAALLISVVLLVLAQLTLGREQQRLEESARTDQLSGLLNRRMFEVLFQQLAAQAQRNGQPLALAIMDIDHFKRVNDSHGHLIGDRLISHVSRRLQARLRAADPLFRWGGEEFLLLMPGCGLHEAQARMESIRRDLHANPMALPAAQQPGCASVAVTLSFGVAEFRPGETSSELLQRADHALYIAKRSGRDRICAEQAQGWVGPLASPPLPGPSATA